MSGGSTPLLPFWLLLAAVVLSGCSYTADSRDREYLMEFCRALDEFSDAMVDSGPATALSRFEADLESITAPARLEEFHADFLGYVREVRADPESLASSSAPRPDPETRAALADVEKDIGECWDASYFDPGD